MVKIYKKMCPAVEIFLKFAKNCIPSEAKKTAENLRWLTGAFAAWNTNLSGGPVQSWGGDWLKLGFTVKKLKKSSWNWLRFRYVRVNVPYQRSLTKKKIMVPKYILFVTLQPWQNLKHLMGMKHEFSCGLGNTSGNKIRNQASDLAASGCSCLN